MDRCGRDNQRMNVREALYANRVTRGMLVSDTSGMQEPNTSATLPDPPLPQMSFSEEGENQSAGPRGSAGQ
jgi:hypothetical protein